MTIEDESPKVKLMIEISPELYGKKKPAEWYHGSAGFFLPYN